MTAEIERKGQTILLLTLYVNQIYPLPEAIKAIAGPLSVTGLILALATWAGPLYRYLKAKPKAEE